MQPAPAPYRSPQVLLMIAAGLAVVILGPYLLYRAASPPSRGTAAPAKSQAAGPVGLDNVLDASELDSLPQTLREGAMLLLLNSDVPDPADSIAALPEPVGENLRNPVSEAVEFTEPVLYWSAFAPPPYSVTVMDERNQVVAQGPTQNTSWTVPVSLRPGGIYTWQVTVPGMVERASFRVLDQAEQNLWKGIRAGHADSHLALGLVAQQLGLLVFAEREFRKLTEQYPDSETAARLLENVVALRDR